MMKTTGVNFTSSCASRFGILLLAERFQIGDIGLSEVSTCGIITQLRLRLAPEIFWIRPSSTSSTSPNLLEVNLRPRQHARDTAAAAAAGAGFSRLTASSRSLNVFAQDTTFTAGAFHFRQVNTELARQAANPGSRERKHRFQRIRFYLLLSQPAQRQACGLSRGSSWCRCSSLSRAAAGAAPSTSKTMIREPVLTLSPVRF